MDDQAGGPAWEGLADTTLSVRDLIGASQDLTVRMAHRMGMAVTDMRAIMMLLERGPMGAAELAANVGIRAASTTVLIDRQEQAGHLERVRDTADRRRVTVSATPAARVAAERVWTPVIRAMDEVCRSIPDADQAAARELLRRLVAVMAHTAQ